MKKISRMVKVPNYLQSQIPKATRARAQNPNTMFRSLMKKKRVGLPVLVHLSAISAIKKYKKSISKGLSVKEIPQS